MLHKQLFAETQLLKCHKPNLSWYVWNSFEHVFSERLTNVHTLQPQKKIYILARSPLRLISFSARLSVSISGMLILSPSMPPTVLH